MRIARALLVSALLPSGARAQDPRPRVPLPDALRPVQERLLAELADPIARSGAVSTPGGPWECSRTLCSATRVVSAATAVDLCRELRTHVGPVTEFRRGDTSLSAAELLACNAYDVERARAGVVFGDGVAGERPPPAGSRTPAYGRAELHIAEVKPLASGGAWPAGPLPFEVRVENTGGTPADVALQVLDLSRGVARWSFTEPGTVEPGRSQSWRVELYATGSEPSGRAFCGERTERVISLVEPATPEPVPGYRPGTAEAGGWVRFRDGDESDNSRSVGIRFECAVRFEVPAPRP